MTKQMLRIRNISKSFGKKQVLNNLSFDCHTGINALLGNNGAGKSTLINIIAGLDNHFSGDIYFENKRLTSKNYPLSKVGYLPQNFDMFPTITGRDYLNYVYDIKKYPLSQREENIHQLITQLNLESMIDKKIGRYSGGYKRRLGIAQAYIGFPELVIIDEPTAGLDPEQREEFRSLLLQFSRKTNTLISTHIIEDVELFSSQIILLKDNDIKFSGKINDFINLAKPYIFSLTITFEELLTLPLNNKQIIERKRLNEKEIIIKYSCENPKAALLNSHQNHDISLENAYVYHQKN